MSTTNRTRFIDHKGKRVILLDFSGITNSDEGVAEIERARDFIARLEADGSHMTLTDVTRTRYDRKTVDAAKALTVHNRPYVKAAAVVSDSSLHRAAISMVALFSRRRLEVFPSRDEALAWLVSQA